MRGLLLPAEIKACSAQSRIDERSAGTCKVVNTLISAKTPVGKQRYSLERQEIERLALEAMGAPFL